MTSLSMRGLVENPYELEIRPTRGTGRKPHPLGEGIAQPSKWLSHPDGALPLPTQGPAVEHLLAARDHCLSRDLDDVADAAWAGLIAHPGLVIPLAHPEADPESSTSQRNFGLVTVYKRADENLTDEGLTHPRLAVTSRLALTLDRGAAFIEAAALHSEWHMSTSGLLVEVDALLHEALPKTISVPTHRRITLMIHPDLSERLSEADHRRLVSTSRLLGSTLDVVDRGRLDNLSLRRRLSGSGGGSLVVAGPMDGTTRTLRDDYLAADPNRLVREVAGSGPRALSESIIEYVTELSGVSGSLLPIVLPDRSPKSRQGRAPIPITNPVGCLHLGDRFYVKDGDSGLWWTRDDVRHAGTIFKSYEESEGVLVHNADHDADGAIINKHKGPIGLRISTSKMHGCPKPSRKHLA